MRKKSVSSLKKKAWSAFSLYIRTKYADWRGYVSCVTCGVTKPIKEMQSGHFIGGRGNSILFEETNVHPQDYICNIRKHGNQLAYYRFMVKKYGEKEVKRLERLSKTTHQFTIAELEKIIKKLTP